jgi:hypothetical protein
MAKLKITSTDQSGQVHDKYVTPTLINGAHIGGTGGDTGQAGYQIQGQVHINGFTSAQGFIIAQKGSHKFRVQDASTNRGVCTLANTPNPASGQMNILVNLSTVTANVAAANVAGGATSTYVTWTGTPTGPVATPRVGDYIIGFAGNAGVAQVTAINTASNVTIATSGNVAAQNSIAITDSTYASRITNKFVYDFNGVKFRYRLAVPDATFVQVQSA